MKRILFLLIGITLLTHSLHAQHKIAVVDVKKAVDKYYKKGELSRELNASAAEKSKALNNMMASYQTMTTEMGALDETMNNFSLSSDVRNEAREKLVELSAQRDFLARDVDSTKRKVQTELDNQRNEMESILAKDIKKVVVTVAEEKGFDLTFDSSYLPNSDYKSILYVSKNVTDLTAAVLERLNASQ